MVCVSAISSHPRGVGYNQLRRYSRDWLNISLITYLLSVRTSKDFSMIIMFSWVNMYIAYKLVVV